MTCRYMACATTGATILFPDEAFNPEATLRSVSIQYSHGPRMFNSQRYGGSAKWINQANASL